MKRTGLLLLGVLLALAVGFLVWQRVTIRQLQADNESLRRSVDELQTLREESARLAKERIDPAELERLRAGQSELVRLRGQVAQLRRQVAEAAANRAASAAKPVSTEPAAPSAAPVARFSSTVQAVVPWKQTLITGGWTLPSGKRALVFIQPHPVEGGAVGQVELQTRIVEMPDAVLAQLGLEGLRSGENESTKSTLLNAEQAAAVAKAMEQTEGVDVLSAPRVITADGQPAQVKMVEMRPTPAGEMYEVGPSIDLVPQISADRTSVQLNVTAQLRLPTAPAK